MLHEQRSCVRRRSRIKRNAVLEGVLLIRNDLFWIRIRVRIFFFNLIINQKEECTYYVPLLYCTVIQYYSPDSMGIKLEINSILSALLILPDPEQIIPDLDPDPQHWLEEEI